MAEIDSTRDARNREAMAAHGLDALICRLPENVLLLTGYWPLSSFAFAVASRENGRYLIAADTELPYIPDEAADEVLSVRSVMLDAPDPYEAMEERLREAIRALGLERARIGHERSFEAVAPGHVAGEVLVPSDVTHALIARASPEATLTDAAPALNEARARKTEREIEKLRLANTVAAFGLEAFCAYFEPGRTEAEVAAQVECAIMTRGIGFRGARQVRAWAQLMSGPGSAAAYSLHPATSSRVLERGDLGLLELGTHVDGYWSDLSRTLVAGGQPSARQEELYAAIVAAHACLMEAARPGMTGGEIDAFARGEIERRGHGRYFVHPTGHGLGFRYHEPRPLLRPDNRDVIEEGMVSSVEPGIYVDGLGGMRLEENVVFTASGVERLSDFSTSLITAGRPT